MPLHFIGLSDKCIICIVYIHIQLVSGGLDKGCSWLFSTYLLWGLIHFIPSLNSLNQNLLFSMEEEPNPLSVSDWHGASFVHEDLG